MSSIFGSEMRVFPQELGSIRSGSRWCWEPLKIDARCYIEVVYVEQKTGGDWWVLCQAIRDGGGVLAGKTVWNELSRFIEAAVLVEPAK